MQLHWCSPAAAEPPHKAQTPLGSDHTAHEHICSGTYAPLSPAHWHAAAVLGCLAILGCMSGSKVYRCRRQQGSKTASKLQRHAHHEAGPVEAMPLREQVALVHVEGLHLRLWQSSAARLRRQGGGKQGHTLTAATAHSGSCWQAPGLLQRLQTGLTSSGLYYWPKTQRRVEGSNCVSSGPQHSARQGWLLAPSSGSRCRLCSAPAQRR